MLLYKYTKTTGLVVVEDSRQNHDLTIYKKTEKLAMCDHFLSEGARLGKLLSKQVADVQRTKAQIANLNDNYGSLKDDHPEAFI